MRALHKTLILLSGALILTSITAYSASPPKSGATCSKAGSTQIYKGKKYSCIKSGKKLVWNKGVNVAKVQPLQTLTPAHSPTLGPTPSALPSPSPIQSTPNLPTTNSEPIRSFSELRVRYSDFHYLAWKRSMEQILKSTENSSQIIELVGPNSKKCFIESIKAIRTTQKLLSNSLLPPGIVILYADKEDEKWLFQETAKLLRPFELTLQAGIQVNPHSVNAETKYGVEWIQDSCTENRINFLNGSATAHGYTHIVQKFQFISNPSHWGTWGKAPRWLMEGGATFVDEIIFFGESESLWMSRSKDRASELNEYGLDFYDDFLRFELDANNGAWGVTDKYPNQRVYDVGSIVCEILVAMKGPSIIIDLYTDFAQTQDFERSFRNKFGVTWSEIKSDIAYTIYKYLQLSY